MTHCLLVDDDAEIRDLLGRYLAGFGMTVDCVPDLTTARARFPGEGARDAASPYHVVLLDVMLPDGSGTDLCRDLRRRWPGLALLMLTAKGDPISRIVGLEIGADDYIAKPFQPRELVARINAVLRRAGQRPPPTALRFAGWTFDRQQRELTSPDGVRTALSKAEFRLLSAFVDHPHKVLSRERLLDLTRGPDDEGDVSDRSIDLAVSRLRQKLGGQAHGPDGGLIRTVRGAGYQFHTEVQ